MSGTGPPDPDSVYNFGVAESRMLAKSCQKYIVFEHCIYPGFLGTFEKKFKYEKLTPEKYSILMQITQDFS